MTVRVAIDARLEAGRAGGVQQGIEALTRGLLHAPSIEAVYVTWAGHDDWLRRNLPPDAEIAALARGRSPLRSVGRVARSHPIGARLIDAGLGVRNRRPAPHRASGALDVAGADVVHFPTQWAELVDRPFVYQPWDLQHRWLPEFFTDTERTRREVEYRAYCQAAAVVLVATRWVGDDVIEAYGVDPARVAVIPPWAPDTPAHPPLRDALADDVSVDESFGIVPAERPFAIYPAQVWPHKNHATLIRSLAVLVAEGVDITLVCTGATGAPVAGLRHLAASLGISDRVVFPGYVADGTLAALRQRARCLVFPSLFEGWGVPVGEAMAAGIPVLCSEGRYLDDVAGDAAVRFDARQVDSIAAALRDTWDDTEARRQLAVRGRAHVETFSWSDIGAALGEMYGRAALHRPVGARR
jgi:glycosyltransferase involved in cell wall biosynthesis